MNNNYYFDAKKVTDEVVAWLRAWFEKNGKGCNAIVGISGGKDSSVIASLCVRALGKDRVIGVLMPKGIQTDIEYAYELIAHLGIKSYQINIETPTNVLLSSLVQENCPVSEQTMVNLPARIRMATLYAVAQSNNGRVIGTGNLSENYVGFFTKGGDGLSDCEPIGNLTVEEVRMVGRELGLPAKLIEKTPTDGLGCGGTDEEKMGFAYETLDNYLRRGDESDVESVEKIKSMHEKNMFKFTPMQMFPYGDIRNN